MLLGHLDGDRASIVRGRALVLRMLGLGVLFAAVTVLTCGVARGAESRRLAGTFGARVLSDPLGVAADGASGDVYVADAGNHRVLKFDSLGNLLLGFGAGVGGAGVDVCASVCAVGTSGSAPGEFVTPDFLAVDESGGPSSGDVYVADTGDDVVSKFDSAGNLVTTWGAGGQLDGSSTGAGKFAPLGGVAVNPSGELFVLVAVPEGNDVFRAKVFKFAQDGTFEAEEKLGERDMKPLGLAIDGKGNLFRATGSGPIEEFTSSYEDLGSVTPAQTSFVPTALTVSQTTGSLYVTTEDTEAEKQTVDQYTFNAAGEVIEPFGSTCPVVMFSEGCHPSSSVSPPFVASGVGVDSHSGNVFVSNPVAGEVATFVPITVPDVRTETASGVGATTSTFNGTVNPDGIALSDCRFEYGTDETYGQSAPCVPAATAIPINGDTAVSAQVEGLEPGTCYDFRLVAANAEGGSPANNERVCTPPPPSIDSAVVTELTATSARLVATINPEGFEAHYRFEYGTTDSYGTTVPVPDGLTPWAEWDVTVAQPISHLSPNVTYHWRVVAVNPNGTTVSPDHTFIYEYAGMNLPDGREYEMVTPAQKNGAVIGFSAGMAPEGASDGSRVMAPTIQCFAGAVSCTASRGLGIGVPYEFSRTSSGWIASSLAPPASISTTSSPWWYSAQGARALFSAPTEPFGEEDLYGRRADGSFADLGPLAPPTPGGLPLLLAGPPADRAQAVAEDLSHVAWEAHTSRDDVTTKWPFDATTGEFTVYEYVGSENAAPILVGVTGGPESHSLVSVCGTRLGATRGLASTQSGMYAHGRVIVFTAVGGEKCEGSEANAGVSVPANELFARIDGESTDAHTVQLSARAADGCTGACVSSPPRDAEFTGASGDGSRVFFLSTQQLTDSALEDPNPADSATNGCGSLVGRNGCNLYMYDSSRPPGEELVDVSAGDTSGAGPRVQGVMAMAEDGTLYFVAHSVLSTEGNALGVKAQEGANNLYVFEPGAGSSTARLRFIAALPASDSGEWALGLGRPANVTPDGRYLVFVSSGRLTSDDTSASGAKQVFRYDAVTNVLSRLSIGERGFGDNGNRPSPTPCETGGCSEDASLAFGQLRSDPSMSDDGAFVFFDSPVGLTPQALDDVQISSDLEGHPVYAQNVYEWHDGHVSLLSDGRDVSADESIPAGCPLVEVGAVREPSSVCLLGADATGKNVFFTTTDQLVAQDPDTERDIYDARVCTTESPCIRSTPPTSPLCAESPCQRGGAGALPLPLAASVLFTQPPGKSGAPVVARARVHSITLHNRTIVLRVGVPLAGHLTIEGRAINTVKRTVSHAGTYEFAVTLKRRELTRARHHRRAAMSLRMRVWFAPTGGSPTAVSVHLRARL
jgi:hypothetical protein